MPKALKSCPQCKKSPNLVTLPRSNPRSWRKHFDYFSTSTIWRREAQESWLASFTKRLHDTSCAKPTNRAWPRSRGTSGSCRRGTSTTGTTLTRWGTKPSSRSPTVRCPTCRTAPQPRWLRWVSTPLGRVEDHS